MSKEMYVYEKKCFKRHIHIRKETYQNINGRMYVERDLKKDACNEMRCSKRRTNI